MIPFAVDLLVASIAAGVIAGAWARGGLQVLAQWLEAGPIRSSLAGTAVGVLWFGGWVLRGAAVKFKEALSS